MEYNFDYLHILNLDTDMLESSGKCFHELADYFQIGSEDFEGLYTTIQGLILRTLIEAYEQKGENLLSRESELSFSEYIGYLLIDFMITNITQKYSFVYSDDFCCKVIENEFVVTYRGKRIAKGV